MAWPFSKKTLSNNVPGVTAQAEMVLKSITLPQASPTWSLFAKNDSRWDIQTAINEGYNASAVVYACVEKRATLFSSVPWKAMIKKSDGSFEPALNSPLQRLLDNPNPDMSMMEIMHEASQSLDLAGNAYWSEIKAGARGLPTQLWPLPAQFVKIKPGKDKLISSYEYQESVKYPIIADDMVHLRLPNPNSRYFGMPVLMAAGRATDIDRQSGDWQKGSLQNRTVADIHVKVPDTLMPDQIEAIRDELKERSDSPANARRPIVSSGDINHLSRTAVEMDFVASRKAVWAEICAVFGMSMSDLGFTESVNLANAEAMQRQLWKNTILPRLELIKRQLNCQLAKEFGPEYVLEYDITNVEALQENFTEKLTNAEALWRLGFSIEAINQRLELGFESEDMPVESDLMSEAENPVDDTEEMKTLLKSVCYGKG